MKKIVFILLCLIWSTKNSKADTIDFCRVYLNGVEIYQNNQNDFGGIFIIKLNSLKGNDKVTLDYFSDSDCINCLSYFQVRDKDSTQVLLVEGIGTRTTVSFRLDELLEYSKIKNKKTFEIYQSVNDKNFTKDDLLFRIKLE